MKPLLFPAVSALFVLGTLGLSGQAISLSDEDVESLHKLIKPQVGESRWMEIDWYPSVWEARKKAAEAKRAAARKAAEVRKKQAEVRRKAAEAKRKRVEKAASQE